MSPAVGTVTVNTTTSTNENKNQIDYLQNKYFWRKKMRYSEEEKNVAGGLAKKKQERMCIRKRKRIKPTEIYQLYKSRE